MAKRRETKRPTKARTLSSGPKETITVTPYNPDGGGGSGSGSGGGGSSGGSGGGGGGGGGGSNIHTPAQEKKEHKEQHKREREAKRNAAASFKLKLQDWGIPLTKGLKKLINRAAKNTWDMDRFLLRLQKTKSYKERFVGIEMFRERGWGEEDYIEMERNYTLKGNQYGYQVDKARFLELVGQGISGEEFEIRLKKRQQILTHQASFDAFGRLLQKQGLIAGPLTLEQLDDFVGGGAPQEWYQLWDKTSAYAAAAGAGLKLGEDITEEQIEALAGAVPGVQEIGDFQEGFAKLADTIRKVLPLSKIAGMGVTQTELFELEFGGPNQQRIADRVTRIVQDVEARKTSTAVQGQPTGVQQAAQERQARRPQSL